MLTRFRTLAAGALVLLSLAGCASLTEPYFPAPAKRPVLAPAKPAPPAPARSRVLAWGGALVVTFLTLVALLGISDAPFRNPAPPEAEFVVTFRAYGDWVSGAAAALPASLFASASASRALASRVMYESLSDCQHAHTGKRLRHETTHGTTLR